MAAVAFTTTGCSPEHGPTRAQIAEQRRLAAQNGPDTPQLHPLDAAGVDQAAAVERSCGAPVRDAAQYVFDDQFQGPVRRLDYARGRGAVTLYFTPARAAVEAMDESKRLRPVPPSTPVPANIIWAFNKAVNDGQTLLTAAGVAAVLPCAGQPLAGAN